MALEEFKDIIATSATISSSIQLLTGIAVCNTFLKKGTTGESTSATFVSKILESILAFCYAIFIYDSFKDRLSPI